MADNLVKSKRLWAIGTFILLGVIFCLAQVYAFSPGSVLENGLKSYNDNDLYWW